MGDDERDAVNTVRETFIGDDERDGANGVWETFRGVAAEEGLVGVCDTFTGDAEWEDTDDVRETTGAAEQEPAAGALVGDSERRVGGGAGAGLVIGREGS